MAVLIEGMEMPRCCAECQFLKWETWYKGELYKHCCQVGKTTYYDNTHCPLEPYSIIESEGEE